MDSLGRRFVKVCKKLPFSIQKFSFGWQKFTYGSSGDNVTNDWPLIASPSKCKPEQTLESLMGHEKQIGERSTMKRLVMIFLVSLILLPPVYAGASDLGEIRFSFIRGDVQVRTDDTDDWVPASINMPLREGDRIWVPEEGMAEL